LWSFSTQAILWFYDLRVTPQHFLSISAMHNSVKKSENLFEVFHMSQVKVNAIITGRKIGQSTPCISSKILPRSAWFTLVSLYPPCFLQISSLDLYTNHYCLVPICWIKRLTVTWKEIHILFVCLVFKQYYYCCHTAYSLLSR